MLNKLPLATVPLANATQVILGKIIWNHLQVISVGKKLASLSIAVQMNINNKNLSNSVNKITDSGRVANFL